MGNQQSDMSPEFESACKRFTESELKDLKALFVSLSAQSRSGGQFIVASVFQAYYGIHGPLGARLFDLVTRRRKDHCLYYEDLVIAKAIYEKGSSEEIENFMHLLMDFLDDKFVQRRDVEATLLSILETVLGPLEAMPGYFLPESSLEGFLNSASFSLKDDKGEQCMSLDDFRQWCNFIPSIKKFLSSLLTPPSPGLLGRHVPHLLLPENADNYATVLRKEYAWHIAGVLEQQDAEDWALLYHSSLHGLSFNTYLKNVLASGGSTILLVKDMEGCIYGGYATHPWERHSYFYGDMKSFLFSLYPCTAIYRPSGANSNLQWCAVNFTSETIPNGIGFGGQVSHFGLFISAGFDRGHSFPSVTYNNPCLSRTPYFVPDVIECWGILRKEDTGNSKGQSTLGGTILERFKEDRHMLNMVGLATASDSL